MSFDGNQNDDSANSETQEKLDPGKTTDRILQLMWHGWGMLVRTISIALIAFFGYLYLDPKSLADVPFSSMTP
ncbi:MAG: hypothetical protein Q8L65_06980, partial [Burkholderiales bacterium]|nr:hypothetical protein [Burkholderiales bacterium]